jgi:hypothetical protein
MAFIRTRDSRPAASQISKSHNMQIQVQILDSENTVHYLRRVETEDLGHLIRQMDQALSVRKRKRRKESNETPTGEQS